jgi:hypothetical protein
MPVPSLMNQGISISVVSDCGLDNQDLILGRGRGFFSSLCISIGFGGGDLAFCPVGTRDKAQLACDID